MFLKSLYLKNFKKFKELSCEFQGDITVIKGPNEHGKSTIVNALAAGLFYDPKKSNEAIRELKSWHSDNLYQIKLVFEQDGDEWELFKDFQKKELLFVNKETKDSVNTYKEVAERLYQMGGYRNLALFESTACVKQGSLYDISSGKRQIEEALQDLATSGENNTNVLDIIKRLEKEIGFLEKGLKGTAKDPGPIKQYSDLIEAKRAEYVELKKQLDGAAAGRERLENVQAEKGKVASGLEISQQEFSDNEKFFRSQEVIERYNADLEKIDSSISQLKKIQEQAAEIERREKNLGNPEAKADNDNLYFIMAGVFTVVGFLGFLIKLFFIGFLGLAVMLALILWRRNKYSAEERNESVVQELAREKARVQGAYEGVLGGRTIEDISLTRREILKRIGIEEEKINMARRKNPPTSRTQTALQLKINGFMKQKEHLDQEGARLQALLSTQKNDEERLLEIEESAEELKSKLEYAKQKLEVYKATRESLLAVKEKTIESLKGRLKDYMNQFIFEITHSRYSQVNVDSNLSVSVYSSEKNDYIEVSKNLSQGTVDQFYLVSRFALLEILSLNKKPLIILDDPFVNFDAKRREHTKHICQELAKKFQILLFTHSDNYDDWGYVLPLEV